MAYRVPRPDELEWITRPHQPGEPARHVAELSDLLVYAHCTPPEDEHAELLESAV